MIVTLKYFKSVVTLTKIKHEFIRSHGGRGGQIKALQKAREELKSIELNDQNSQGDINECMLSVELALLYLADNNTLLDDEAYVDVMVRVLDTYFVPLDLNGTEAERVTWMEAAIDSFINTFSSLNKRSLGDPSFEYLLRQCKGDIDVTYNDCFTKDMQEAVSNYDDFLHLCYKLGVGPEDGQPIRVGISNIFS